MKQAKPLRRRRKGPDALLTAKLDTAWAELIRSRGACEWCGRGSGVLHAHHVFGRQNRRLRWDEANGLALCFLCHRRWHDNPGLSWPWFCERFPATAHYLLLAAREITHYTLADKKEKLAELQSSLAMGQAA